MPTYQLVLDDDGGEPRRVAFTAECPDYALQVAQREADGVRAELWKGERLIARMTKVATNLWKLDPDQRPSPLARQP